MEITSLLKRSKAFLIKIHNICFRWETRKMSHRTTNPHSLITVFAVRMKLPTERTAKTLIRLGGCPGWPESSLGAHAIFFGFVVGWYNVVFFFFLRKNSAFSGAMVNYRLWLLSKVRHIFTVKGLAKSNTETDKTGLKARYPSKNRHFIIQERFNKLIFGINTVIIMWHITVYNISVSLSFLKWYVFYRVSELMLPTLIQRYDKKSFIFYTVQKRDTNWNFTGCQMPHFMIVLILYINLSNLSWIKDVYFWGICSL